MNETIARLTAALADRYRIEVGSGHAPTLLGQGGMATVYLARDLKHKRKVVRKVLEPRGSHGTHRLERVLGMPAEFWLTLQQDWDLWHAITGPAIASACARSSQGLALVKPSEWVTLSGTLIPSCHPFPNVSRRPSPTATASSARWGRVAWRRCTSPRT